MSYCYSTMYVFISIHTQSVKKLHETFHSVTYPATAKIVARQVARKVEPNSVLSATALAACLATILQGMSHCEMLRATCPTTVSPKLHETLCYVTR